MKIVCGCLAIRSAGATLATVNNTTSTAAAFNRTYNATTRDHGNLCDYANGEHIRAATAAERAESDGAGPEGVITVDGRSCYVQP